jgi:hypothetical protein
MGAATEVVVSAVASNRLMEKARSPRTLGARPRPPADCQGPSDDSERDDEQHELSSSAGSGWRQPGFREQQVVDENATSAVGSGHGPADDSHRDDRHEWTADASGWRSPAQDGDGDSRDDDRCDCRTPAGRRTSRADREGCGDYSDINDGTSQCALRHQG